MSIKIMDNILECIYPKRCPLCEHILVDKASDICSECGQELQLVTGPVCMKCGKPLLHMEEEYCHDCNTKRFHFDRGFALWVYEGKIKKSIYEFKYHGKRENASFYVIEMVKHLGSQIRNIRPDALVPIPIHKHKQQVRGYNQADVLAKGIGEKLQIPVISDLLLRSKNTMPQKSLNDKERFFNLQEAFQYNDKLSQRYTGKLETIVLVDDIYTTGSTIEACAKVLLSHQVKTVYFIVLCIGKGL